jgi:hypothetical protein
MKKTLAYYSAGFVGANSEVVGLALCWSFEDDFNYFIILPESSLINLMDFSANHFRNQKAQRQVTRSQPYDRELRRFIAQHICTYLAYSVFECKIFFPTFKTL